MPIALTCACSRALRVKEAFAGRKVRCPSCAHVLTVPAPGGRGIQDAEATYALVAGPPARKTPPPLPIGLATAPRVLRVRPLPIAAETLSEEQPFRKGRRKKPRHAPRTALADGWFGSLNAGAVGGALMMAIAVVWFVAGLAGGIIFFYPPVLLVVGFIAIIKGLMGGE